MALNLPAGVQINAPIKPEWESILTTEALTLVAKLHRAFEARRQELLKARVTRQARIDAGVDEIIFSLLGGDPAQMDLLMKEIRPHLRPRR